MADRSVHCSPGVAASTSQLEFGSRALPSPVVFTVLVAPAGCGSIAARVAETGLVGNSVQRMSSKVTGVTWTQLLKLKALAKHFLRRVNFISVLLAPLLILRPITAGSSPWWTLNRPFAAIVRIQSAVTGGCVFRRRIPSGK